MVEETALQVAKYDNVSIRQGHEKLADFFEQNGDEEEALAEYNALIALKAPSATPYLKVCEALIKREQPQSVPNLLNESLIFDQSPLTYILLGEAYNGLGEFADAITAFEQAQRAGAPPNDPHVLLGLSYAYRQTGQLDKLQLLQAEKGTSTTSMQQAQGDAQLYQLLQRADQLIQANEFDRALLDLQTSLRLKETSQAHTWIGQIYMQKRQYNLAIDHLEKARAMGSSEPLLLYNLSVTLYQEKEYARAQMVLDDLEKTSPQFGDPYDLKSKISQHRAP
jgi:tetratricopeptide (TPR) repeat protein